MTTIGTLGVDNLEFKDTGVRTSKLDCSVGGEITLQTFLDATVELKGLSAPTTADSACNKAYVDNLFTGGSTWLEPAKTASVQNETIAGLGQIFLIDGVLMAPNDKFLLKDQTTASENGVYVVQVSGVPLRSDDMPAAANASGMALFVQEGTVNADRAYVCTSDPSVIGTDDLTFTHFGDQSMIAGDGIDITASTISVDTTVLRTSGNQSASGIQTITNATQTTTGLDGALVIAGGVGIGLDLRTVGTSYALSHIATSDAVFKENIEPIDHKTLDKFNLIQTKKYNWKKDVSSDRHNKYGVIAQQLEDIGLDDLVYDSVNGKAVDYNGLVALLINEVITLKKKLL